MNEQEWNDYMALLAQEDNTSTAHCVGCWYDEHAEPFPAQDSSSLCDAHATATRRGNSRQEGGTQ
jgi:hypothetical protein